MALLKRKGLGRPGKRLGKVVSLPASGRARSRGLATASAVGVTLTINEAIAGRHSSAAAFGLASAVAAASSRLARLNAARRLARACIGRENLASHVAGIYREAGAGRLAQEIELLGRIRIIPKAGFRQRMALKKEFRDGIARNLSSEIAGEIAATHLADKIIEIGKARNLGGRGKKK